MKSVLLFPGQGSQYKSMSLDLLESKDFLQKYINVVKTITEKNFVDIMQDEADVAKIENSQICIFLASVLVLETLKAEFQFDVTNHTFVAGHSLGEYSALYAAEAITFETAVKMLQIRSKCMKEVNSDLSLGMASVLGDNLYPKISSCINSLTKKLRTEISIANFNSESQIVVSGTVEAIDVFTAAANAFEIKKVIKLPVSSAFHSRFMVDAKNNFAEAISSVDIATPKIPIIMNSTAEPTTNPVEIKQNLINNISEQVKWHQSIDFAYKSEVKKFIQIGCKEILVNMIKRVSYYENINAICINSAMNLQKI